MAQLIEFTCETGVGGSCSGSGNSSSSGGGSVGGVGSGSGGGSVGGCRLDVWLSSKLSGCSRSHIQKAISEGRVLVNGQKALKNYIVKNGDRVLLEAPDPADRPSGLAPQDIGLKIVFEDDWIIVIDKPRGMVTHPGSGVHDGTLANALAYHFNGGLSDMGGEYRPGIVHRLDKDTSGLIVAAKTNEAHYRLAEEFKGRRVRKIYHAIVCGRVERDRGRIEMPIGRDRADRKRMAVTEDGGREAVTLFNVVMRLPCAYTWLELEILTGRTHQIRVHMARIGYPVAGDATYGRRAHMSGCIGRGNCAVRFRGNNCDSCPITGFTGGQMLHAASIAFTHPITGEQLVFNSELPFYFPERR